MPTPQPTPVPTPQPTPVPTPAPTPVGVIDNFDVTHSPTPSSLEADTEYFARTESTGANVPTESDIVGLQREIRVRPEGNVVPASGGQPGTTRGWNVQQGRLLLSINGFDVTLGTVVLRYDGTDDDAQALDAAAGQGLSVGGQGRDWSGRTWQLVYNSDSVANVQFRIYSDTDAHSSLNDTMRVTSSMTPASITTLVDSGALWQQTGTDPADFTAVTALEMRIFYPFEADITLRDWRWIDFGP